ncbi:aminoacyl-tRNA deacylase [Streptococcus merionis]|uniref:Cys-tRNA(Pro)/Cys-tRNA(Cys) deacylase n=1 Tax=Streptococcus merionis TaxID=400065 RepID=A0A239SPJ3_9STRE|nr:aminoacyl-tRNA deacylase [Streptococcus merionis]SNU87182.1 regulatory protein [Streptococcus merionis]
MAKKAKLKKTLVEQILDKAGIVHEPVLFNMMDEKARLEIPQAHIFKTLALIGDKTGPIIGIVPLTGHLSEKKLAHVSGNKKVHMIPQKDLQKTTGYVHGANNPVGIRQKHRFPIIIDQSSLELEQMIVSAGELGRSIAISPRDLANFVQAEFADILSDKF